MRVPKDLIPFYLKVLEPEVKKAIRGKSVFADHNGIVYLTEAIDILKKYKKTGFDHKKMRWQVWNAMTTMTPDVLRNRKLTDAQYGKAVKLCWITNFKLAIADLEKWEDKAVRRSLPSKARWMQYIVNIGG